MLTESGAEKSLQHFLACAILYLRSCNERLPYTEEEAATDVGLCRFLFAILFYYIVGVLVSVGERAASCAALTQKEKNCSAPVSGGGVVRRTM